MSSNILEHSWITIDIKGSDIIAVAIVAVSPAVVDLILEEARKV